MKGFEPVPWNGGLPGGGPLERTYGEAVAAWETCWQGIAPQRFIANLTDCHLRPPHPREGPVTGTDSRYVSQAWVCSPWTAFGLYGFAEAAKVSNRLTRVAAKAGALGAALTLIPAAPDHHLQVRSFLFSTPIHPPEQDGPLLAAEMSDLAEQSQRPVLCRGLARGWRIDEIDAAIGEGLLAIPTRAVWLFDGRMPDYLRRHNTRMDLSLARRAQPLRLIDPARVEPWVWARLAELYSQLYLQKHNRLNPAYSAAFMQAAATSGLVEFLVFPSRQRPEQSFDAFVGLFSGAGQATCPLVGVELQRQKPEGLYRMACALCFGLAASRGHQLNFSSGAGRFKQLRGGIQSLEYALLALPTEARMRRRFWSILGHAVERWAAPLLLREGL